MPASIYIWDGISDGNETEIALAGNIGAMFVDNGINYVFYQDPTFTGGYKLGYISGSQIKNLCSFEGTLPTFGQVTKYKNFIIWATSGKIWAFGSSDNGMTQMVFKLSSARYGTAGALAAPFGTPLIASTNGTNYDLSYFYGYSVSAYWYSMMFPEGKSTLQDLTVYFDPLTTGARCDITIVRDNGKQTYTGFSITETTLTSKTFPMGIKIDNNFRVQFSWANGSTVYPVKINRFEANVLKDNG
jgi:hypothetical protein